MIRLTRSRTEITGLPADLARLREQFDREHYLRLPGLIEPVFLRQILDHIERGPFAPRSQHEYGEELNLTNHATLDLLTLLVNDRRFFEVIQDATGSGRIGCFEGRVYRMIPAAGHYDSWHDDVAPTRLLAMSVNLSPKVYDGGVLQIRDRATGVIVTEVANTAPADAIVFRICPALEHCVSPVVGSAPKTAYAGWFHSEPDFEALMREQLSRR